MEIKACFPSKCSRLCKYLSHLCRYFLLQSLSLRHDKQFLIYRCPKDLADVASSMILSSCRNSWENISVHTGVNLKGLNSSSCISLTEQCFGERGHRTLFSLDFLYCFLFVAQRGLVDKLANFTKMWTASTTDYWFLRLSYLKSTRTPVMFYITFRCFTCALAVLFWCLSSLAGSSRSRSQWLTFSPSTSLIDVFLVNSRASSGIFYK